MAETMAADRASFVNEDWIVAEDGLEHRSTGYRIEREQIGRRRADGLWAWPSHMLEKSWVAPATFAEAFRNAARLFGLRIDDAFALSFEDAGWTECEPAGRQRTAEVVPHPALSRTGEAARDDAASASAAQRRRRHG